jgi:hypothetical protein
LGDEIPETIPPLLANPAEGDAQGVQHALLGENPAPVIENIAVQFDGAQV